MRGDPVNETMREGTVLKDALEHPDPAFCKTCGDHVDDHGASGTACELGDCRCRAFTPER